MIAAPPLLPAELKLVTDVQEFHKICEAAGVKNGKDEVDPSYTGLTRFISRDCSPLIVVFIKPSEDYVSVCVHEAVHVWQFCLEYMSETSPGWEIEAYSIQKIVEFLLKSYVEINISP